VAIRKWQRIARHSRPSSGAERQEPTHQHHNDHADDDPSHDVTEIERPAESVALRHNQSPVASVEVKDSEAPLLRVAAGKEHVVHSTRLNFRYTVGPLGGSLDEPNLDRQTFAPPIFLTRKLTRVQVGVGVMGHPSRLEALKIDENVRKLGLKHGQVVADLGAGTGLFSVPLGKAVAPAGKVYAVEIDMRFFPMIEEKAKQSKLSDVKTVLGEFTDPNLRPPTLLLHSCMMLLQHHVENRSTYLKNAARYVKPGGRFVVIDYPANSTPHTDQPNLIVSEEQVTEWMKAAGFGRVQKVDLFPDKYFLVFSRM
jgi:arsenite methyltransferase